VPPPAHLSTDAAADTLRRRGITIRAITIATGRPWRTMLARSARRGHKFADVRLARIAELDEYAHKAIARSDSLSLIAVFTPIVLLCGIICRSAQYLVPHTQVASKLRDDNTSIIGSAMRGADGLLT
jgi:hypothetical protein